MMYDPEFALQRERDVVDLKAHWARYAEIREWDEETLEIVYRAIDAMHESYNDWHEELDPIEKSKKYEYWQKYYELFEKFTNGIRQAVQDELNNNIDR